MTALRSEVLKCFKSLHRARKTIFQGDINALTACRDKINKEFHKNKHVKDAAAINELIKFAIDVERELRTSVVQAKECQPGHYELRITEDTRKLVNKPYNDCEEKVTYRENQCANPDNCHCKGGM